MQRRVGFTLVEMIIAITIMVVLLSLAIVMIGGSRANARDNERKTDVANIARFLEQFYENSPRGSTYPNTLDVNTSNIETTFTDFDLNNLKAPLQETYSLIPATNGLESTTGVRPLPTIHQYVYQPLADVSYDLGVMRLCVTSSATCGLCDNTTMKCRKFNIYYRSEVDNQIYSITSKIQ